MKKRLILSTIILALLVLSCTKEYKHRRDIKNAEYGIVIHGGAGGILKQNFTPEKKAEYIAKLNEAIETGYTIIENGGTSLDAVEATIKILEDSPMFNAGKGAVFNAAGQNELDASIMDGKTLNAGAVAGINTVKNPISLARKVMEESPHVMMVGDGAEKFGRQFELEFVDPEYFYTEARMKNLERAKQREAEKLEKEKEEKMGTVGCAALDKFGNLAAGTSTGGMTNKKYGRVGDSPIIGAGTYANNRTCAISATGHGEYFIRNVVTYDISALMEYRGLSLKEASERVVMGKLKQQNASGGIISIDKNGNVAMVFNTSGMFRGYKLANGKSEIKLFGD